MKKKNPNYFYFASLSHGVFSPTDLLRVVCYLSENFPPPFYVFVRKIVKTWMKVSKISFRKLSVDVTTQLTNTSANLPLRGEKNFSFYFLWGKPVEFCCCFIDIEGGRECFFSHFSHSLLSLKCVCVLVHIALYIENPRNSLFYVAKEEQLTNL